MFTSGLWKVENSKKPRPKGSVAPS